MNDFRITIAEAAEKIAELLREHYRHWPNKGWIHARGYVLKETAPLATNVWAAIRRMLSTAEEDGAVAIETALCLPLICFAALGVIATGQAENSRLQLQAGAQVVAEATAAGAGAPAGAMPGGASYTVTCNGGSCSGTIASGTVVEVAATLPGCWSLLGHVAPCSATGWASKP